MFYSVLFSSPSEMLCFARVCNMKIWQLWWRLGFIQLNRSTAVDSVIQCMWTSLWFLCKDTLFNYWCWI